MNEKTRILDEAIEEVKEKMKEVAEATLPKEDEETSTNKGKKKVIYLEDEVPAPDPHVPDDQEPFLKALKAIGGKHLEKIPMFYGKMDAEVVP